MVNINKKLNGFNTPIIFSQGFLEKQKPLAKALICIGAAADRYVSVSNHYIKGPIRKEIPIKGHARETTLKVISYVLTAFILPALALIAKVLYKNWAEKNMQTEKKKLNLKEIDQIILDHLKALEQKLSHSDQVRHFIKLNKFLHIRNQRFELLRGHLKALKEELIHNNAMEPLLELDKWVEINYHKYDSDKTMVKFYDAIMLQVNKKPEPNIEQKIAKKELNPLENLSREEIDQAILVKLQALEQEPNDVEQMKHLLEIDQLAKVKFGRTNSIKRHLDALKKDLPDDDTMEHLDKLDKMKIENHFKGATVRGEIMIKYLYGLPKLTKDIENKKVEGQYFQKVKKAKINKTLPPNFQRLDAFVMNAICRIMRNNARRLFEFMSNFSLDQQRVITSKFGNNLIAYKPTRVAFLSNSGRNKLWLLEASGEKVKAQTKNITGTVIIKMDNFWKVNTDLVTQKQFIDNQPSKWCNPEIWDDEPIVTKAKAVEVEEVPDLNGTAVV